MANNPYVNKVVYGNQTLIDISDTTAVAADVASGKYFYTATGQKVQGTGSGGGGYVTQDQDGYIVLPPTGGGGSTLITKTITVNGTYDAEDDGADGYSSVTVNVSGGVTWDTVYNGGVTIYSSNPNYAIIQNFTPALAADQTWRITWNGNEFIYSTEYSSQLSSYYIGNPSVVGGTDDGSGATFFGYMQSGNLTFATTNSVGGITLKMERRESGPTRHTIHLEFSDSTDTDIDVYYDDSLLGTMITVYEPSVWTYNNKTVVTATLDNTTWYDKTITWETVFEDSNTVFNSEPNDSFAYTTDLASTHITANSMWRVTWGNEVRIHTAVYGKAYPEQYADGWIIDSLNDGTNGTYTMFDGNSFWLFIDFDDFSNHSKYVKLERAVLS